MITFGIFNWLRSVDDMIDGDNPQSNQINLPSYIKDKNDILRKIVGTTYIHIHNSEKQKGSTVKPWEYKNIYDAGLAYACMSGERLRAGDMIKDHVLTIWELMVDERGVCTSPLPAHILNTFAAKQDKAIAELMCFLIGADAKKFQNLWSNRGMFTKIDWITDLEDDLSKRVIHISEETLAAAQCTTSDLINIKSHRFACARIELQHISAAWNELEKDRTALSATFASPIMRFIFNKVALDGFKRRLEKLLATYERN
jgi:hypothetical protein